MFRSRLLPALTLLAACFAESATPAGNSAESPATLDAMAVPQATLTEEMRLDANAEDFSVVRFIVASDRGHVAVPLRQDNEIRIYDASGAALGRFGRRGEGPGEFVELTNVGWVADTVWAHDRQTNRITYVTTSGELLRSEQIRVPFALDSLSGEGAGQEVAFFTVSHVSADGTVTGEGRYMIPGENRISPGYLIRRSAGGSARALASMRPPEDPSWYIEVDGLGTGMPFAMRPLTAMSADGTTLAVLAPDTITPSGGALRLTLYRSAADTVLERTYPFAGVPVTEAERDSAIAELNPGGVPREGPANMYQRRQEIARAGMPPIHAPATGLRFGTDGTIWIDLMERTEGRFTLVLDESGTPVASVSVPPGVVIRQANRTHIWATETDALGLSSVVRYRVSGIP